MLQNYLKIAWRHLWKNKVFSFINIFGLAVGIAFTLLTAAYIWSEIRINRDLKDADNQYIVLSKWKDPNTGPDIATIAQLTIALKDYPALVRNAYHFDGITSVVSKGDMHFRETMQIGDSTLLSMYGFKLQQGNAVTAFSDPYSVVITSRMAEKYFGRTNVVGQTLNFESFKGHFMDDAMAKMYTNELHLRKAAYIASVLAVVIALLGVLGLVALSIQKRTREIGIRKVLGSSVAGITTLFLKDFMTVVVVVMAALIACPVAWLLMQYWLQGYAYRVNITMMPFIITVGVFTLMTVMLIVLQTAKAALVKPVESLRNNE